MPTQFALKNQLAGFAASPAVAGGKVSVVYRELVPPVHAHHLLERLEHLQRVLFSAIPDFLSPSIVDHVVVVIRPDLNAIAYVNELLIKGTIKPNRPIEAGEAVMVSDIEDVTSIELGVEVPDDAAVVIVRSFGWRRSLFFDFGPLQDEPISRDYSLESVLAEQTLLLLGLADADATHDPDHGRRLQRMKAGLDRLEQLIVERDTNEGVYQELIADHPWMLGGVYDRVERHEKLDDKRIPDFTARRTYDQMHDIIEIKQPFLSLFKHTGLAATFNDAWNQAETYISFAVRQRSYLAEEKELHFENPQCVLILGCELSEPERRRIRQKEGMNRTITVRTYDELLRTGHHVIKLMQAAEGRPAGEGSLEVGP